MNKRVVIVILTVLVLIVVGGVVLYLSVIGENDSETQKPRSGGIFPFLGGSRERDAATGDVDVPGDGDAVNNVDDRQQAGGTSLPRFRQLWREPVAGATFGKNLRGSTTIRFIERATGHIYETLPMSAVSTRLTNTTIPRIQEVVWISQDNVLIRYMRDDSDIVETFAATIVMPEEAATSTNNTVGELRGKFLPIDILSVVGAENSIFYLLRQGTGVRGVVSNFDGSGAKEIFSSPIRDWIPQWVSKGSVTMTTKASADVLGHMFLLNTSTGVMRPIISNISGITTNTNKDITLYTENKSSAPILFSYNRASDKIALLPIGALTEKCVFGALNQSVVFCAAHKEFVSETLPDEWYKGVVHFNDQLWRVDTGTLSSDVILDPETLANKEFDIVDLAIDNKEEYIIFRNKTDNTLWIYQMTPVSATTTLTN